MIPISFARLGFGLEGRKALNPTQSQEQSVIKVGLKLLEQLKNKVNNQMLKTKYLKSIYEYGMLLKLLSFG